MSSSAENKRCGICSQSVAAGQGEALFTADCSTRITAADLELRLPIIKISNEEEEEEEEEDEICRSSEEDCHTPRSPRHMIPTALRSPQAPKKRRSSAACKRRLCELHFFEV